MSKFTIPQPPQPSFAEYSLSGASRSSANVRSSATARLTRVSEAALDEGFLRRVLSSTLWLGALLSLSIYLVFQSAFFAVSFAAGALLSAALLWSQMAFIGRLAVAAKMKKSRPARKLSWRDLAAALAMPLKYGALIVLIGFLIYGQRVAPVTFVAGVSLTQVVIVAKVLGKMLAGRSIAEVYVNKGTHAR